MTKFKPLPPLAVLQEFLSYDPETGLFVWVNKKPKSRRIPGTVAGSIWKDGYRRIMFQYKAYAAHRFAWLYLTGEDPGSSLIDHIDRNRSNNRADNLRLATYSQNQWNQVSKGWIYTKEGRCQARITHSHEFQYLGVFDTPEEAHQAYVQAALQKRPDRAPVCYIDEVTDH